MIESSVVSLPKITVTFPIKQVWWYSSILAKTSQKKSKALLYLFSKRFVVSSNPQNIALAWIIYYRVGNKLMKHTKFRLSSFYITYIKYLKYGDFAVVIDSSKPLGYFLKF
ncbi:hypothetical protein EVAR_85980_1 [Eumeta japonica]|uniref:Uncharacterized protein n=1 Tax=Eumeta variegata TaxID=151549 RepID=A0A4C1UJ80_EUMVA|nr:hypothetical protein EVAR_85980_1 [Eumeta japonica]